MAPRLLMESAFIPHCSDWATVNFSKLYPSAERHGNKVNRRKTATRTDICRAFYPAADLAHRYIAAGLRACRRVEPAPRGGYYCGVPVNVLPFAVWPTITPFALIPVT